MSRMSRTAPPPDERWTPLLHSVVLFFVRPLSLEITSVWLHSGWVYQPGKHITAVPQTTSCCCCTLRATCCVVICVPARVSRSRSTAAFCPSGFLCSSLLYALPCDSTRETTRRRDPTNPYALIYTCAVMLGTYLPICLTRNALPPKTAVPLLAPADLLSITYINLLLCPIPLLCWSTKALGGAGKGGKVQRRIAQAAQNVR